MLSTLFFVLLIWFLPHHIKCHVIASSIHPSGVFTAPRAGLYSFSFTAYSRRASAGDRMFFQLQLLRNGEVMASVWEENRQDPEDSSTQGLLLSLERGGQVYVLLRAGRMLCGDAAGRNTFSGYMVHGM